ncbi:hypothetical protein FVER14953_20831 [Fusarium verticillioides]|nr:hypothetical protein FVER14953_20831 [Fusarium verticillioides]
MARPKLFASTPFGLSSSVNGIDLSLPASGHDENQLASGKEWGNTLQDAIFNISTPQNPLTFGEDSSDTLRV